MIYHICKKKKKKEEEKKNGIKVILAIHSKFEYRAL